MLFGQIFFKYVLNFKADGKKDLRAVKDFRYTFYLIFERGSDDYNSAALCNRSQTYGTAGRRKELFLYILDTLADWEIGFLTAELKCGRYTSKKTRCKLILTGNNLEPIETIGGMLISPEISVDDTEFKEGDVLILPGADTWMDGCNKKILQEVPMFPVKPKANVVPIEKQIEADFLRPVLEDHGISHVFVSYHDTAFADMYQQQNGWGFVEVAIEEVEKVREFYAEVKESLNNGT
jgi:hypothetical protein